MPLLIRGRRVKQGDLETNSSLLFDSAISLNVLVSCTKGFDNGYNHSGVLIALRRVWFFAFVQCFFVFFPLLCWNGKRASTAGRQPLQLESGRLRQNGRNKIIAEDKGAKSYSLR